MSRTQPLYKRIEADLLEQINLGRYQKGDCIPPEQALCARYGVSRVTIRKALQQLVDQGLLTRTPGVGTRVARLPITPKLPGLAGFAEEMRAQGLTPRTEVTQFCLQPADARIAQQLGVAEGAPVYYFKRSQYADNALFLLESTHMSAEAFPGISLQVLQTGKYRYVEKRLGLKIAGHHHIITPILADAALARLLDLPAGTPLLKDENTTFLEDGRVLDFTEQVYNSTRYQLEYYRR